MTGEARAYHSLIQFLSKFAMSAVLPSFSSLRKTPLQPKAAKFRVPEVNGVKPGKTRYGRAWAEAVAAEARKLKGILPGA